MNAQVKGLRHAARIAAGAVAFVLLAGTAPALASVELRGVIVSVSAAQDEVVVRHDASPGMPAMTMSFQVEPSESIAQLHAGDRITARADLSANPAQLAGIRVVGHEADGAVGIPRNLKVGVQGPLGGVGLLAIVLAILALVSWLMYRFARILFKEEPAGKD
jgi:Cu/Ag efflux protein CusF